MRPPELVLPRYFLTWSKAEVEVGRVELLPGHYPERRTASEVTIPAGCTLALKKEPAE